MLGSLGTQTAVKVVNHYNRYNLAAQNVSDIESFSSTALLTPNQPSLTFVQQPPAESAAQYQHRNMDWVCFTAVICPLLGLENAGRKTAASQSWTSGATWEVSAGLHLKSVCSRQCWNQMCVEVAYSIISSVFGCSTSHRGRKYY